MNLQNGSFLVGKKTYKIISLLGQGSFGITYKVSCVSDNKIYAIKEFFMKNTSLRLADGSVVSQREDSLEGYYLRYFHQEAEVLSKISHPNIVPVHETFENNNTCYYVMDFVEGENISSYMKKHKIAEQEAKRIICDVANALHYMHDRHKVLHLDIKPNNIMRNKDGHIYLIDFGLCKDYHTDDVSNKQVNNFGTKGYAPIEQATYSYDIQTFSPTLDIYALGATFFHLITGNVPHDSVELVSNFALLTEPLKQQNISQNTTDAIVWAMQPNKKKRPQTINEFLDFIRTSESKGEITNTNIICKEDTILGNSISRVTTNSNFHHGHEFVDLGLSVKWAKSNLGADTEFENGLCFTWGAINPNNGIPLHSAFCIEKEDWEKAWNRYFDSSDKSGLRFKRYFHSQDLPFHLLLKALINKNFLRDKALNKIQPENGDDTARELWKGLWRLPTSAEFNELIGKCKWDWVKRGKMIGYSVIGPNGNQIFLPLTDSLDGYYWTNELADFMDKNTRPEYVKLTSQNAKVLRFSESIIKLDFENRIMNFSVRPVL